MRKTEPSRIREKNETAFGIRSKMKKLLINLSLSLSVLLVLSVLTEGGLRAYAKVAASDICGFANFQNERIGSVFQFASNGLGLELKPGGKGSLAYKSITINQDGLREDADYSLAKPANTFRVAVIGDSVTFGWGVDAKDSYPKLLEMILKKTTDKNIEVLNFGVPGYNGEQKLIVLKEKVLKYDPDLVVIGWLNDDDNPPAYLTGIPFIPYPLLNFLNSHSYFFSCIRENIVKKAIQADIAPLRARYHEGAPGWTETKTLFKEIAEVSAEKKVPVVIAVLPIWQTREENESDGIGEVNNAIEKIALDNNLRAVDLLPRIYPIEYSQYYIVTKGDVAHPDSRGHFIIAVELYNFLARSGLIPWPVRTIDSVKFR